MLADTYEGRLHLPKRTDTCRRSRNAWWTRRGWSGSSHASIPWRSASRGGEVDATRISTCTAEKMALHLIVDTAEGATRDGSLATDLSLPADPA